MEWADGCTPYSKPEDWATPGHLTKQQYQVLKELESKVKEVIQDPSQSDITVQLYSQIQTEVHLLRFLRARDFKIKKAFEMIKQSVIWRTDFVGKGYSKSDFPALVQFHLDGTARIGGKDLDGRPIIILSPAAFFPRLVDDTLEVVYFFVYYVERLVQITEACGFSEFTAIANLENWSLRQNFSFTISKILASLLQDNYPERLRYAFVVNNPWAFTTAWNMISPFLEERVKAKIHVLGSNLEKLLSYIAPDELEKAFGGKHPGFPIPDPIVGPLINASEPIIVNPLIPNPRMAATTTTPTTSMLLENNVDLGPLSLNASSTPTRSLSGSTGIGLKSSSNGNLKQPQKNQDSPKLRFLPSLSFRSKDSNYSSQEIGSTSPTTQKMSIQRKASNVKREHVRGLLARLTSRRSSDKLGVSSIGSNSFLVASESDEIIDSSGGIDSTKPASQFAVEPMSPSGIPTRVRITIFGWIPDQKKENPMIQELLNQNFDVTVFVNTEYSSLNKLVHSSRIQVVSGSPTNKLDLDRALEGAGIAFSLEGAYALDSLANPHAIESSVALETKFTLLIEALKRSKVRRFVFVSSAFVIERPRWTLLYRYGMSLTPTHESYLQSLAALEKMTMSVKYDGMEYLIIRVERVSNNNNKSIATTTHSISLVNNNDDRSSSFFTLFGENQSVTFQQLGKLFAEEGISSLFANKMLLMISSNLHNHGRKNPSFSSARYCIIMTIILLVSISILAIMFRTSLYYDKSSA